MAAVKNLDMQFGTEGGEKATITVHYVKDDLVEADITTLMDAIIAKNIFLTKGGELKSKIGASITTTDVQKLQFS